MGLSLLSALEIQGNETLIATYQDKESRKYGYTITHTEEKDYRSIVSGKPVYILQDDALAAGTDLMQQIKKVKLIPRKKCLIDMVAKDTTVKTVSSAP